MFCIVMLRTQVSGDVSLGTRPFTSQRLMPVVVSAWQHTKCFETDKCKAADWKCTQVLHNTLCKANLLLSSIHCLGQMVPFGQIPWP